MAEEINANGEPTEKAADPVVDTKALAEQLEQIKKAQAGSDKAYQETMKQKSALEAELEKLKKEKMSEKEKAEYEIARQRSELDAKAKEVAVATLGLIKHKVLGEKNVPIDLAEYISGNDEAEIRTNADTFLKRFDEAVGKRVNERLGSGTKPEAGSPIAPISLPEDWRQLEARYQGKN